MELLQAYMPGFHKLFYRVALLLCLQLSLVACEKGEWNNPHRMEDSDRKVLYSVFTSRPKHLDPVRTYNLDEATFIDQIYEPPLEYHYLKRPYELEPATMVEMPEVLLLDEEGKVLPEGTKSPAYSKYIFRIRPGILYQPHPAFAQTQEGQPFYHWEREQDAREYRKLEDFTEQGTKELVADDYIYQYKRMADPSLQMPIWDLVSHYVVGIKEAREELKEKKDLLPDGDDWLDLREINISGIEKIDSHSFSVTLNGIYPQFKYWLAFHFFAPVPVEVDRFYHLPGMVDKQITLDFHPVGTGAYMMTRHNPNAEIILERNPNFREQFYPSEGEKGEEGDEEKGLLKDAGKRLPLVDKVVFRLEKEAIPIWTKFLQGYYDRSGISSDSFDQAVTVSVDGISLSDEMIAKGIQLSTAIEPATYYLGFNMLDETVGDKNAADPEKNRKLRRAIAIAFNEDEQISIFRNGRGEVAQSPLPPGVFGYQSGEEGINPYVFDWVKGEPRRKSLEEAKQLLAEAGYPDGRDAKTGKPLVLNLDTTTVGGGGSARQNWIIKQFRNIGIQLNIRATDYNRFQDKMEKGNAQIFFWGWFADYPDPENFLFLLYGPNSRVNSGGSGVNSSNYDNPEYNRLFNKMKTMEDSPERLEIIEEMLDIFHRDLPWASGFHPQTFALSNSWMQNYKPHGISQVTLKFQNLDTALREEKRQEWNQPVLWPIGLMILIIFAVALPGYKAYLRRQTRRGV